MGVAEEQTLTERQRYWLGHIRACEVSGKTIAEYSMDQGIVAKAMYAGKKQCSPAELIARHLFRGESVST
jgi:hypothetical protein